MKKHVKIREVSANCERVGRLPGTKEGKRRAWSSQNLRISSYRSLRPHGSSPPRSRPATKGSISITAGYRRGCGAVEALSGTTKARAPEGMLRGNGQGVVRKET